MRGHELLGPTGGLAEPGVNADTRIGQELFQRLLTGSFHPGLIIVFVAAAVMMFLAVAASYFAGDKGGHAPRHRCRSHD
ncbi:hypothetical protein OH799_28385 [Nocardia sp. NBC_00881]|uniref:hypothetical protein n=1 Tax=Nocardia sp. NBC_00881 TaxID=2975995 RepID=UPI003868885A|nr:hypothetical protein OH799_28385 [Nocardia sp. NBC_00881]